MHGPYAHALRVPVDLDALLINDQVQRQLSPQAMRNQLAGGGYFEGAASSPIGALRRLTPQTVALPLADARLSSKTTAPVFDSPVIGHPGGPAGTAVQVGR